VAMPKTIQPVMRSSLLCNSMGACHLHLSGENKEFRDNKNPAFKKFTLGQTHKGRIIF
jgi:hypothetical protein